MRLALLCSLLVAAVRADYAGPLRPQVHYSPPQGFMNDPNGLFYDAKRGIYHNYYQYNPSDIIAGNQHWGHATSSDLYHWTNHPIALYPDSADHYIFSGSAVVDSENTSGFFPNQDDGVVAIYTVDAPDIENQHIAYSTDGGYTFTKYSGNPVINSTSKHFRDPQVTWHPETKKWVMSVAYAQDFIIGFFSSPDLKTWTHESNFTQSGLPGDQFECPNLVKFSVDSSISDQRTKYALFISINPGAPLGGSATYYVVGDFNGTHFTSETPEEKFLDFAKDNYASQWYSNLPEDKPPVSLGWASNWNYTGEVPTGPLEGWRSSQTIPTVHTLTKVDGKWTVTSNPFDDMSSVKGDLLHGKTVEGDVSFDFSKVESNAITFKLDINGIPTNPTGEISFNFTSSQSNDFLDGGIHIDTGFFWINRAGTHNFTTENNLFYSPHLNTTVSIADGHFDFTAIIDRSVFEVLLDQGAQRGTVVFYPTKPLDTLTVSSGDLDDGTTWHVDAWGLKSGWS